MCLCNNDSNQVFSQVTLYYHNNYAQHLRRWVSALIPLSE